MEEEVNFRKIIFVLKEVYTKNYDKANLLDIINFSEFELHKHWNDAFDNAFNLTIHTDLDIYTKFYSTIKVISEIIRLDVQKVSSLLIGKVKILPDYEKIHPLSSEIRPVYTDWEEINAAQLKLVEMLKKSSGSIEFQNIGNASRTILQKVANIVFKSEKHSPADKTIDVSSGKFKNQLHSYIKVELGGDAQKELKQFADAAINTVEKAIDLANALTHKLGAERTIAEVCIIGTISAISIVKLVEKKK